MNLSIVIPHYNRINLLLECLDSIVANNYPQELYEVIVIDDCSTQNISPITQYAKIKNYKFEQLKENSGTASAPRNHGIDIATGERLLFIDSDDKISNGFLQKGMALAEKGDCDIVVVKRVDRHASFYSSYKEDSHEISADDLDLLLDDNHIHSKFYRMGIIKKYGIKFDTNIKICEDYHFSLRVWPLLKTAGICVSESYIFMVADSIGLSRSKFGKNEVAYLISKIVHDIFELPEDVVSLDKKAKIINRVFKYSFSGRLIDSPKHLLRLKREIGGYLSLVKDFQLSERSRERLNVILDCPPDGRSKFADFEWKLDDAPTSEGRKILFRANNEEYWQAAPSEATAIGDGWMLGTDKRKGGYGIYRWNGNGWNRMPGAAIQIGGSYQRPWIINDSDVRYVWNGGTWKKA
ncbi:MAG: glycosyltransferase [Zoogloeaceae bacterium]|jgi:glycosyltransferase involved in cell wall biosynthesis|nr:glycosyltransferase [Zoogloeaceae bacterium]